MSVSFTYTVDPPTSVNAPSTLPESGEVSARVEPDSATARSATEAFYAGAVPALRAAQAQLNDHLTVWKDVIGDAEKHKENTGKAEKGKGKAARLMMANKAAEASNDSDESDESSGETEA